jgi:hypothetical protein
VICGEFPQLSTCDICACSCGLSSVFIMASMYRRVRSRWSPRQERPVSNNNGVLLFRDLGRKYLYPFAAKSFLSTKSSPAPHSTGHGCLDGWWSKWPMHQKETSPLSLMAEKWIGMLLLLNAYDAGSQPQKACCTLLFPCSSPPHQIDP